MTMAEEETAETERGIDAWSTAALSGALGLDEDVVEQALMEGVGEGTITLLESGPYRFFVSGSLAPALDRMDAVPVEGERLMARRTTARRARVRSRVRDLRGREDER